MFMTDNTKKKYKLVQGTPSLVLFPAKNYFFRVIDEEYLIEIPIEGLYKDLDTSLFKDDSGGFDLMVDDTFYSYQLSKVLFASSQYPDLEFNQFFAPTTITFKNKHVYVVGHIIEMMLSTAKD
jgi:hypothetical protein